MAHPRPELINGTASYLFTNDFEPQVNQSQSEPILRHGYSHLSQTPPKDESGVPITIFKADDTDMFVAMHRDMKHPNVFFPLSVNKKGVVVEGHQLPCMKWCKLFEEHLRRKSAGNRSLPAVGRIIIRNDEWVKAIYPYFDDMFCGVAKGMTHLHAQGGVHGNIQNGIFVGSTNLNEQLRISSDVPKPFSITGYIGNFKKLLGTDDRKKVRVEDRKSLLKVMLTVLTFPSPVDSITGVRNLLDGSVKGRRYLEFLTELDQEVSSISTLGFFYPCFWGFEEDGLFMDLMFKIIYREMMPATTRETRLNDVFRGVGDWTKGIRDPELLFVLNYKQGGETNKNNATEDDNAVVEDDSSYLDNICIIRFFRNGVEHRPKREQPYFKSIEKIENKFPYDVVALVHKCTQSFVGEAMLARVRVRPSFAKQIRRQVLQLLTESFCSAPLKREGRECRQQL